MKRNKIDLEKLKKELPSGCYDSIAQESDLSVDMVTKVLNGKRNNLKVIEIALKKAAEEQLRIKRITKMADSI